VWQAWANLLLCASPADGEIPLMRSRYSQSIRWAVLLLGLAAFWAGPGSARAQVNVNISAGVNFSAGLAINSVQDFYDPLAGYGAWFDLPPYGRVWQPADVDPAWRPYEVGHWEWTDVGWYWVSDEPWAWATYHYGSWAYDPTYAWIWVPGTTWAPAWVVWRESPQYIGWAPCGPNGLVLPAPLFAFVDIHHFHSHFGPRDFVVDNQTIINRTRVINNFRTVDRTFDGRGRRRVVMNEGPSVNVVERAVGTRFTPQPIREVVSHEPAPSTIQRRTSDLNGSRPNAGAAAANPAATCKAAVELSRKIEFLKNGLPYAQKPAKIRRFCLNAGTIQKTKISHGHWAAIGTESLLLGCERALQG
jgi:hypothetical protein